MNIKFNFNIPPQIIFGCGSISQLPSKIRDLKGRKPLIVTSRGAPGRDSVKNIFASLHSTNILYQIYSQLTPEPSILNAQNCLKFAKENGFDLIIALGGGSVMDVAKKVAMDLELPKIMIPTTAGTGSEVTHEAVLKVDGKKKAIVDIRLTADIAIIDPDLTMTMPPRLTASSGIDALAHAIECYESRRSNLLVKVLAFEAFKILRENVKKAIEGDRQAKINMSLGSMMAGMAFGNSGTSLGHALSYPLSNRGAPHGEAVAMVSPYALEFNAADPALIREVREITGLIKPKWDAGWNIQEMAKEVMSDERHLVNNPRMVTYKDVFRIFERINVSFREG